MNLLLLHQNFPGQFRRLAQSWARLPGWQVLGLARHMAADLPAAFWVNLLDRVDKLGKR